MSWVQTIHGKVMDFNFPDPEQVYIEDIAHSLSRLPHFNGHLNQTITIAEHCLAVSYMAEKEAPEGRRIEAGLWGLLHDAGEAYTGDMPGPLKRLLDEYYGPDNLYRRIETRINNAILIRLGMHPLNINTADLVKRVDRRVQYTEHIRLQTGEPRAWNWLADMLAYSPEELDLQGLRPNEAKINFLDRFISLHTAYMDIEGLDVVDYGAH
jgi:uncharacterized protein